MKPTLKKTLSGYVVKHECACGETLNNKIAEVGTQDACPSCKRAFIVPGEDLVLKLKAKLAAEKEKSNAAKKLAQQHKTEQRKIRDDERREQLLNQEPKDPVSLGMTHSVDEDKLQKLADAAGEGIGLLGTLAFLAAIIVQGCYIMWIIFTVLMQIRQTGQFGPADAGVVIAVTFCVSACIWICYYFVKVQIGMVAAVILIERNTRHAAD